VRNRRDRPSDPGDPRGPDGFGGISVETGTGRSSSAGLGDRLILLVAILALLGGGLIVAGRLVGDRLTAKASATPSASPSALPSALASPSGIPLTFVVQPGPLPSQPPQRPYFNGWIRALADVPLYSQPDRSATKVGILKRGAIAFGSDNADPSMPDLGTDRWLTLQNDVGSYVLASRGSKKYVELLTSGNDAQDGYIEQIVSGADRFVVVGAPPAAPGATSTQFLDVSTDGETWVSAKTGAMSGHITSVADGPAGWLAITEIPSPFTYAQAIWRSEDAISWRAVGLLPDSATTQVSFSRLIGSSAGYLLIADRGRSVQAPSVLWSTDGAGWQQVTLPAEIGTRNVQLTSAPWGFYLQAIDYGQLGATSIGASSFDGTTWVMDRNAPTGSGLQVAPTEDGMVGVSISPIGGEPRAWTASLEGGALLWKPDGNGTAALRGSVIPTLLSDGHNVLALGASRASQAPLAFAWHGPDGPWHVDPLPRAAFGGGLQNTGGAISTDAGTLFLTLGSRPTLASANQTLWRRTPEGQWAASSEQLLPYLPDPPKSHCPARPRTALEFVLLNTGQAVSCFGSSAMTFRARASVCSDCNSSGPGYSPAWLADPNLQLLSLSPAEFQGGLQVVLAPGMTPDQQWDTHWVQVTGHFDDPAAPSCRYDPSAQDGPGVYSSAFMVLDCRRKFVVTRITLVSGP
jgi:hypothetical protein